MLLCSYFFPCSAINLFRNDLISVLFYFIHSYLQRALTCALHSTIKGT